MDNRRGVLALNNLKRHLELMAFGSRVFRVMIASPGDTIEERDAIERALHGWNADRSEREQVVLLPVRWETTAVPRLGASGQSIIMNNSSITRTY
jgi:hypothetical protein